MARSRISVAWRGSGKSSIARHEDVDLALPTRGRRLRRSAAQTAKMWWSSQLLAARQFRPPTSTRRLSCANLISPSLRTRSARCSPSCCSPKAKRSPKRVRQSTLGGRFDGNGTLEPYHFPSSDRWYCLASPSSSVAQLPFEGCRQSIKLLQSVIRRLPCTYIQVLQLSTPL